ncbi:MAG: DUF86 domain-containing protein [bacterium]|nr:DUF86 domain-containing protein [bacterium]
MEVSNIKNKIEKLQEYVEKLSPYATMETDILLSNEEKRAAMERWFLLLVDEAVDINAVISYQIGKKIPDSYRSSFEGLVELGIIDRDFSDNISVSAKVRNQMTHDYEKIQHKELIELMKKFFEMYKKYTRILIEEFINRSQS